MKKKKPTSLEEALKEAIRENLLDPGPKRVYSSRLEERGGRRRAGDAQCRGPGRGSRAGKAGRGRGRGSHAVVQQGPLRSRTGRAAGPRELSDVVPSHGGY